MPTGHGKQNLWDIPALMRAPDAEWIDAGGGVHEAYYPGQPRRGKPTRVFAYCGLPQGVTEPVPGMVLVHGGGGTAFREWVDIWTARGYAAIAMDLNGCGPERRPLPDGAPGQGHDGKFHRMADGLRETWPYHAVANTLRATSLLAALPEVDESRIGLTGISWGGYTACMASGLDPRLKCVVPVYGCGFLHEHSTWLGEFGAMSAEHRALWIEHFDPSAHLPRAAMPMLWVNGTNDFAYHMPSHRKSSRLPTGPRTLCVTVRMEHGHEPGWGPAEIGLFVDSHLGGGVPLASLSETQLDGDLVTATVDSETEIVSAELAWTSQHGPWPERYWHTKPAEIDGGLVRADLPADRPLAYFVTITDARGARVSSEYRDLAE